MVKKSDTAEVSLKVTGTDNSGIISFYDVIIQQVPESVQLPSATYKNDFLGTTFNTILTNDDVDTGVNADQTSSDSYTLSAWVKPVDNGLFSCRYN